MLEVWQERLEQLKANKLFELFVIAVIIFSALLIGVHTYENELFSTETMMVLKVLDFAVTLFFLVEILIRFLAEKNKKDFFRNGWNIFDTLIVTVSLIPIDNTETAVLGRLIRIFRVLRMVSIIPELRLLLNSLLKALPQLGYVMLLMFIIFYIYAAIGSTLFENVNKELWGNISIAMLTLFRVMTFEDWTDVMYETMKHPEGSPFSWIYYLTFIFFTTFAFLNMVIGIVVNVMEQERHKLYAEEHPDEPDLASLQQDIRELKALVLHNRQHNQQKPAGNE
ncbi:MAG: ion transporter [Gammaproteobacteria bacterium]|nr:MAG: ion transporter [Gammaproteobacteria bacterium]